jgi:hypothetical protein
MRSLEGQLSDLRSDGNGHWFVLGWVVISPYLRELESSRTAYA